MASADDINSTIQNVARNLGLLAQAEQAIATAVVEMATPFVATTTASPKFTGVQLGTSAVTTVIASSTTRKGLILHNVGSTVIAYVFPSLTSPTPTTTALAGAMAIPPGASVAFSPTSFFNVTAGWSGFVTTSSAQPFTVIEFY